MSHPGLPFGRRWLPEWPLDPGGTYLNHGTVGVAPRRVMEARRAILDSIERQPSRFLLRELAAVTFGTPLRPQPRLREAADGVAAFLGARGDDLAFVDNATSGANAVLRSFPLAPGDELLVSDLGYGGITRAALFIARERGAHLRTVAMPYPFTAEGLTDAWSAAVGPRTRLAVVDHVSADAAIVLPLAEIAAVLKRLGVAVLADGAHAPGAIPLDIPSLGVDWYVGNLHKWAWVPRSSGVLWAAPDRQAGLHPAVISWGLDEGFTTEFDMPGTRDPSAHLAAPAALALLEEWGFADIRRHNHDLAWRGAQRLAERWDTTIDTPEPLIGSMAMVTLPIAAGTSRDDAIAMRDHLLFDKGIEVHMHAYRGQVRARISAQIYNDMTDVDRLADAVLDRLN
jgi:isopenicillin-N epimerase